MGHDERQAIRRFITAQLAKRSEHRELTDRDDVIASGIVDSLGILQLVAFLESTFAIRVRDDDILPENFASVDAIASYVQRSR